MKFGNNKIAIFLVMSIEKQSRLGDSEKKSMLREKSKFQRTTLSS